MKKKEWNVFFWKINKTLICFLYNCMVQVVFLQSVRTKGTPLSYNIFLWAAETHWISLKSTFGKVSVIVCLCHEAFRTSALSLWWWNPIIWQNLHIKRAAGISDPHFHRNDRGSSKGNSFFLVTLDRQIAMNARMTSLTLRAVYREHFQIRCYSDPPQTTIRVRHHSRYRDWNWEWLENEVRSDFRRINTDKNNMLCVHCCFFNQWLHLFVFLLLFVFHPVVAFL